MMVGRPSVFLFLENMVTCSGVNCFLFQVVSECVLQSGSTKKMPTTNLHNRMMYQMRSVLEPQNPQNHRLINFEKICPWTGVVSSWVFQLPIFFNFPGIVNDLITLYHPSTPV